MVDFTVRVVEPEELRTAADIFHTSLHMAPPKDEQWEPVRRGYQPGRTLGAFEPAMIGTARSMDAEFAVPGGTRLPLAAVTGVGVRADRTRRGVLTALMRTQLDDFAERGVPAAMLHATEGAIYGRYGYGVATLGKRLTVDRRRARLRPEVPAGGEVELLDPATALDRLPEIFDGLGGARPGTMSRPAVWWAGFEGWMTRSTDPVATVVHHGAGGPDGFARYTVSRDGGKTSMRVDGMHVANDAALVGLWRFLLGVDLVDEITVAGRPLDEPVELLFADPRSCRVEGVGEEIWLRLVDVPGALAAREYVGERVVLEVVDPLVRTNSGRYAVSGDGASRTDEPAELRCDVETLAMLYLGTWRASALAAAGRVEVVEAAALTRADSLFSTRSSAWCGTFF